MKTYRERVAYRWGMLAGVGCAAAGIVIAFLIYFWMGVQAAVSGSVDEPVQFAIITNDDGFDWKWLIAAVLVPVAGLAIAWRSQHRRTRK